MVKIVPIFNKMVVPPPYHHHIYVASPYPASPSGKGSYNQISLDDGSRAVTSFFLAPYVVGLAAVCFAFLHARGMFAGVARY